MPVLWYVKDGPRPDTTRGGGIQLSFAELNEAFGKYTPEFLSEEPPEFNVDIPSQYPVRVVIEVRAEEGHDPRFSKPGFYWVPDLSPQQAGELLSETNKKK